jgi:hypothetical protein
MRARRALAVGAVAWVGTVAILRAGDSPPVLSAPLAEALAGGGGQSELRLGTEGRGSGIQVTPDEARILISKDVDGARWSISQNLDDGTVTGNVFFPEGGDPLFLFCEQRAKVGEDIELRCSSTGACSRTACPEFEVADDIVLHESFFELPAAIAAITEGTEAVPSQRSHDADIAPSNGSAQNHPNRPSGIRGTPDGRRVLISKDVAGQRWSIVRNLDDLTVTGNVFFPDGADPKFLFCRQQDEIGARLRFQCAAADACSDTACPEFASIGDVTLPESFFEPPTPPTPVPPEPSCACPTPSRSAPGATADRTATPSPAPSSTSPPAPSPSPMQSITLPSPSPSPSPTPVRFPRTPPAAPPTPTRVRPSASPPGSPTPTPLQTPPSPLPSATPTPVVFGPTPLATPTPPDAPTPTAAGVRIFGIVQTHCRNGNVDAGEECDHGKGNLECVRGVAAFAAQCEPPCTVCEPPACAYCRRIYPPDPPPAALCDFCERGRLGIRRTPRVCGTDPLGKPRGDDALCTIEVGGSFLRGGCTGISKSGSLDFLDGFLVTECSDVTCVPEEVLRGDCKRGDRGMPCSLDVEDVLETGTCERTSGSGRLVCRTSRLCP